MIVYGIPEHMTQQSLAKSKNKLKHLQICDDNPKKTQKLSADLKIVYAKPLFYQSS